MGFLGFGSGKKKEAAAQLAQQQAEQQRLLARQKEIGAKLYQEIRDAADKNKLANVKPKSGETIKGVADPEVSLIKIEKIEDDKKGTYSIYAGMDSRKSNTVWYPGRPGYPILYITINMTLKGKEINVFKAPYGPNYEFSEQNVVPASTSACGMVSSYRLYPPN